MKKEPAEAVVKKMKKEPAEAVVKKVKKEPAEAVHPRGRGALRALNSLRLLVCAGGRQEGEEGTGREGVRAIVRPRGPDALNARLRLLVRAGDRG